MTADIEDFVKASKSTWLENFLFAIVCRGFTKAKLSWRIRL